MRIAIITPGFSAHAEDWAIPALLNLARGFAKEIEVHIFSQRYPVRGTYRFEGLTHHAAGGGQRFGLASARIWLQTSRAIIAQHRRTPFDLLHAFWADEAGFSAAIAGTVIKRPVIVSLGGGELTYLPDIDYGAQRFLARRLTTRYAFRQAALVTAGSGYQLDLCRQHGMAEKKLCFAPLGIDIQYFQPASWKQRRIEGWKIGGLKSTCPPTIIQAASLLPVKNQKLLLEIFKLVKEEIPTVKLNLVGDGPLRDELRQLAGQADLQSNIAWRRQIAYPEMPAQYRQANLYLQTSRHESQGLAVLEAMACGLPVLGTPVGIVKDVACLPPASSAEVLATQVVEVFRDPTRYQALGQQARQMVEEQFSLPATMNNFLKIYVTAQTCHPSTSLRINFDQQEKSPK